MISYSDLKSLAAEWGIADHVAEKNYVIGWLLWGIGQDQELKDKWIFKGGTCLKKCYLETYRFSEDLDFTVLPDGPINPEDVQPILKRVLERVHDESGINFSAREPLVEKKEFPFYAKGRIYYQGPRNAPTPASVIIDLLSSEKVIDPPVVNKIAHSYPDDLPESAEVLCYSLEEIFAEKIRAMGERGMPRDLYDIVFLFRDRFSKQKNELIKSILIAKCETKGVAVPTYGSVKDSPSVEELKSEWANMLKHQLPALPPFEEYWNALPDLFKWLEGLYEPAKLQPIAATRGDHLISQLSGPALESIRRKPVEAMRFAAVSHLCVEMRYRKENLEVKDYLIQPYSLRQSDQGNIILYAAKAQSGEMRSFRIDRIIDVHITSTPFVPRYPIEFPEFGTIYAPPIERERKISLGHSYSAARQTKHTGPTYIYKCHVCGKTFKHSKNDSKLNKHKNTSGSPCYGTYGVYQRMEY